MLKQTKYTVMFCSVQLNMCTHLKYNNYENQQWCVTKSQNVLSRYETLVFKLSNWWTRNAYQMIWY